MNNNTMENNTEISKYKKYHKYFNKRFLVK